MEFARFSELMTFAAPNMQFKALIIFARTTFGGRLTRC
jgi:hypothetical protein